MFPFQEVITAASMDCSKFQKNMHSCDENKIGEDDRQPVRSAGWFVSLLIHLREREILLTSSDEQYFCEGAG